MLRSVIVSASNSCFVACPGCYNHFSKDIAPTSALVDFVRALHDQVGLKKVTIGGGDPLVRPDIIPLLRALNEVPIRINLDTVGSAFLHDTPIRFMGRGMAARVDPRQVVSLVDLIGIPLDGSTDEISRYFRRFSSVADQDTILANLDRLHGSVCVNTVVHAANVDDLPEIASIVCRHPCVEEWQLFQFMPIGPLGHRNRSRFQVDDEVFLEAVNPLRRELSENLRFTVKSASMRKNRYLLIDAAGFAWYPKQNTTTSWGHDDTNEERIIVGSIDDRATVERIIQLF